MLVEKIHQHEGFRYLKGVTHGKIPDMDFAILELKHNLNITDKVKPACLPENDDNNYVGKKGRFFCSGR